MRRTSKLFETCRRHYINNRTWGQPLGKYVDKAGVKEIVKAMNIDGLKIPKTISLYNNETLPSFDLEAMKRIPQPYIVKTTHTSGGVSRVENDQWKCLKPIRGMKCVNEPLERTALIHASLKKQLEVDFSLIRRIDHQTQYKDIPRQVMVEEDISNEIKRDVSYWYASNGRPLFASIQCSPTTDHGTRQDRAFVNINFKLLHMSLSKQVCSESQLVRPHNWEKQVEIATALAKEVLGIVRIDLYPGEKSVIFSEFTYTTSFCAPKFGFHPRVADGLLHAVQYGAIDPQAATPQLVESIIHDASWVLIQSEDSRLVTSNSTSFPSPVDLCEHVNKDHINYADRKWQGDDRVKKCLDAAQHATSSLRCIFTTNNTRFEVFSDAKVPTFRAVMDHVDYGRAITLLLLLVILTCVDVGTKHQKNQYLNNLFYLIAMLCVIRATAPNVESVFSTYSIVDTVKQSFMAFAYVHPMDPPHIALCHFATYWFLIASWTSKSPRNLLFWQFLFETITASVNEYSHLLENDNAIHCSRVAFKESVSMSAFDEVIRVYVLPPFFVYGYLLPNFTFYWISEVSFLLWIVALLILLWFVVIKVRSDTTRGTTVQVENIHHKN